MRLRRAVFLDRDGTLNYDFGYVHKPEEWQWLPGAREALRALKNAGYLLAVVSNQSGIGRGYYDQASVAALQEYVQRQLEPLEARIDAWHYCPHLPDAGCPCRKPKPGLLLAAADELDVNLAHSWMIGDRLGDVEAGLNAGCRAGLLLNPAYAQDAAAVRRLYPNAPVWRDWPAVLKQLLAPEAESGCLTDA